jgi:hypothetical protein
LLSIIRKKLGSGKYKLVTSSAHGMRGMPGEKPGPYAMYFKPAVDWNTGLRLEEALDAFL